MEKIAANLLEITWKGIPNDYKSKYRRNIWEQYENAIRSSAYTNNLGKFINTLCLKFNIQIKTDDVESIEKILNSGNDKKLLKLFREETTLIVLMVRLRNQERKEKFEKEPTYSELFDAHATIEKGV